MASSAPLVAKQSSASRVGKATLTNEDVLRTEVPWASFATAGIMSKEQLEMITRVGEASGVLHTARLMLRELEALRTLRLEPQSHRRRSTGAAAD